MSADTPSQSDGIFLRLAPYHDILGDVMLLLAGEDIDDTPLLRMAAMAIELELAERMTDALGGSSLSH